jgi:hypothetical protein
MARNGIPPNTSSSIRLLCHFALWFGLAFATPVFVAFHNVDGTGLSPKVVVPCAALLALAGSFFSWWMTSLLPSCRRPMVDTLVLALAILLAIWGNGIHDLFEFGVFDGRPINFRENKIVFWLEGLAWLAAGLLLLRLIARLRRIPAWLPALPIVSFCLLLVPPVLNPPQKGLEVSTPKAVDASVYDFSSISNLVHLLPDGFQGDTVKQAFAENPKLAARFEGFTLFTDHLGRYPGTAPSIYSMLTGEPFSLARGFSYSWVGPEIRKSSYQAELARQGFQVDLVPISNYICPEKVSSCHPRPFKNRGYSRETQRQLGYSIRLLADLSLFRLAPLFLKEQIYDKGYWLLSDIAADENAPLPDPILREWTQKLRVVNDRPVYKWYHYMGTHVPPHWDASCRLQRNLEAVRENYVAQTHCILNGIADFIDRLKSENIYDNTAIIISGDHGHNTIPSDQEGLPFNYGMYEPLLGTGRPALLVKPPNSSTPLSFSPAPTDLMNIAPTALTLAGLQTNGRSVFDVAATERRKRVFQHYPVGPFWSGNPVPYLEYRVQQPANDASHWQLVDMVGYDRSPSEYLPLNKKEAKGFAHGAKLRSSIGENRSSWIRGRQLAFLIDVPSPPSRLKLEIELAFEPWMKQQTFSVQLNGGSAWHSGPVPQDRFDSKFRSWSIPVTLADLRQGPDFVSLVFEHTYIEPGSDNDIAAARIRNVMLIQAN